MPPIIPLIIGILAVITFLWSYQLKRRSGIIILNATSRCLYILQYLLLGAISGAALDILGTLASFIAGKKDSAFVKKRLKLIFIAVNLVIIATGVTIAVINRSLIDLLPVAGVLLHTGAFWMSNERTIRKISFLGSPFWLVYNISTNALGSAIGDILTMASIIISMIRQGDFKKSPKGD